MWKRQVKTIRELTYHRLYWGFFLFIININYLASGEDFLRKIIEFSPQNMIYDNLRRNVLIVFQYLSFIKNIELAPSGFSCLFELVWKPHNVGPGAADGALVVATTAIVAWVLRLKVPDGASTRHPSQSKHRTPKCQ